MPRKGQCLPIAERFWSKVDKSGDCWVWTGKLTRTGYGQIRYQRSSGRWSHTVAHRVAWEIANGPIPSGQLALHKCDNRPCVNPSHLFLGSHVDNARDREAKSRGGALLGSRHPAAKLSESDVIAIRASDQPVAYLAERFHVSTGTVRDAIKGRTWQHLQPHSKIRNTLKKMKRGEKEAA